jgi:hypothetical protein
MSDSVPKPYATTWEYEYDQRTEECVDAALAAAIKGQAPRLWPITGPDATEFNPDGFEPFPLAERTKSAPDPPAPPAA